MRPPRPDHWARSEDLAADRGLERRHMEAGLGPMRYLDRAAGELPGGQANGRGDGRTAVLMPIGGRDHAAG